MKNGYLKQENGILIWTNYFIYTARKTDTSKFKLQLTVKYKKQNKCFRCATERRPKLILFSN